MKILSNLGLFFLLLCQIGIASAEDLNITPHHDTTTGNWLIRLRALAVVPDEKSSSISIIGGRVSDISSTVVPELDFSYFFTKNIASELILATTRHSVKATRTALGPLDLGKVSLLPPTLTIQYHFFEPEHKVRPYVGAGINYTLFYHDDAGPVASSISYENSFGPVLQAGLNIGLNEHFSINFDVKKVYIDSDVHVRALDSSMKTHVDINPVLYAIGIGYHF